MGMLFNSIYKYGYIYLLFQIVQINLNTFSHPPTTMLRNTQNTFQEILLISMDSWSKSNLDWSFDPCNVCTRWTHPLNLNSSSCNPKEKRIISTENRSCSWNSNDHFNAIVFSFVSEQYYTNTETEDPVDVDIDVIFSLQYSIN